MARSTSAPGRPARCRRSGRRARARRAMAPSLLRAALWVAKKELVCALRDRQTVLYAVVIPLALYPVILWVLIQGALLVQGRDEHTAVVVGIAAEAPEAVPEGLRAALDGTALAVPGAPGRERDRVHVEAAPAPLGRDAARAWLQGPGGPDAVLWIPRSE